ncbi:MAG TPA: hypothetical protein VK475_05985, partial [Pyrinomonadaceae bacterium]|nr:hypothetical protein [Pyrinomonadaceae bacterium]
DDCRSCAERLADERTITDQLRDFAGSTESAGAPARVEAHLLAAFDQRSGVRNQTSAIQNYSAQLPAPLVWERKNMRRYWVGAIAAALLLVFGLSVVRWRQGLPTNRDSAALVAQAGSPAAINTGLATNQSAAPTTPSHIPGADVSRRKPLIKHRDPVAARPQPDNAANTEIATDFLPMSYGSTANLQDGGQMVRVELPRSAMASFGLPVNMDRANEKVKADVLLGVDGLAHAIRFVR